jgi:dTDP-4-amino-4,6-dideoxygalactose transaminase
MTVPFLDVAAGYRELKLEIDHAISSVLENGCFILGEELRSFEDEFAEYVGVRHCIGVGNGLEALRLSLLSAGIGPGDEVIVPSNTYIASWLAVSQVGAQPVPVEPRLDTYNLDPALVEAAITPKTAALLPVHLYGQPADMPALLEIVASHGLFVLEDAAQAHGARCAGTRVGAIGNASAWSFYPAKNLGCFGDGGAVTTNDDQIADRVRLLRNYGSRRKYENETIGYNSRLDDLQAAVLRVKLRHLDEWNQRRSTVAQRFLKDLSDLELLLPLVPDYAEPVWHLFVVRSASRDQLQRDLETGGIATQIHYPIPPHMQRAYSMLGYADGAFPISELIHKEVLSLPIGPHLEEHQIHDIVSTVRGASALRLST